MAVPRDPTGVFQEDAGVQQKPRIQEPKLYRVILHNDHYTTMDFVVEVLQRFFKKSHDEAVKITLMIHTQGSGVGGIYSREIAEAKVAQVTDAARARGFPLKCTAEPQ